MWSLTLAVMENFKCLSPHICENLNKKDANVSVNLIDACEIHCKELSKFLKTAKKFQKE